MDIRGLTPDVREGGGTRRTYVVKAVFRYLDLIILGLGNDPQDSMRNDLRSHDQNVEGRREGILVLGE